LVFHSSTTEINTLFYKQKNLTLYVVYQAGKIALHELYCQAVETS